jgi:hypothetical protein
MQIAKNANGAMGGGTVLMDPVVGAVSTSSLQTAVGANFDVYLTAGDYLEMFVLQNAGTAVNLVAGAYTSYLQMHWLSA